MGRIRPRTKSWAPARKKGWRRERRDWSSVIWTSLSLIKKRQNAPSLPLPVTSYCDPKRSLRVIWTKTTTVIINISFSLLRLLPKGEKYLGELLWPMLLKRACWLRRASWYNVELLATFRRCGRTERRTDAAAVPVRERGRLADCAWQVRDC